MKLLITLFLISTFIFANTKKNYTFEGLTQISPKIAIEQLSNNNLNDAIKQFYNFGYFDDIKAYDEGNNTIKLVFSEKPFIVNIQMKGYKTRQEDLDLLYSSIHIKKGTMYTKEKIKKSKLLLLEELKKEGYVNSVVETEIKTLNKQSVSLTYHVNKGEEVIIKKVNFYGAKNLSAEDFDDFVANRDEDLVSWWFGNSDGVMQFSQLQYENHRIKDVYLQNGYLDAKVSPAFSKIDFNTNTAEIDYKVKEGDQYITNKITIFTDESIVPLKTLQEGLKEKIGKHFNINNLRKDINFIKTQIADKGYAFVEINYDIRKNVEDKTADVIFNVLPGKKVYINDVIISGNTRTLDRVIRRNIYLAPRDLYNLTDFKESKAALGRSGYFEGVSIDQKKLDDNLVDIIVKVKEAPTGNLIVGGGYGSYDGWMLNASINDKNIFGSGMDLGLSLEHSGKKDLGKISLKNPSIQDSIYSGTFSIYQQDSVITASTGSTYGNENTLLKGGSVGVGRALGRHARIGLTYAIENKDVTYDTNDSANYSYVTSSLSPYINYNTTDDYYVPRHGIKAGDSFKYVGLGGDAKYIQNTTYFKYFYGLQDLIEYDWIIRYKATAKILINQGEIPNDVTFYLGGPTSVRGYQSYAFQPSDGEEPYKKYLTNTAEISFPLFPKAKMRWALFYDIGRVGAKSLNEVKKSGYGASLNWYSPVGPIQFIFSRAINPDPSDNTSSFEFSLGTSF